MLTVTPIYAATLAIMMIGLSMYVSSLRADRAISLGTGNDTQMLERIRRHGNFAESVPMALLVLAIGEVSGLPAIWVHAAGGVLILSRIIQPLGLAHDKTFTALRLAGNIGTFAAMLIPVAYIFWTSFA